MEGNRKMTGCLQTFVGHCIFCNPHWDNNHVYSPGGGSVGAVSMETRVLDKRRLQELVKEVDPLEQLDEDVEEVGGASSLKALRGVEYLKTAISFGLRSIRFHINIDVHKILTQMPFPYTCISLCDCKMFLPFWTLNITYRVILTCFALSFYT